MLIAVSDQSAYPNIQIRALFIISFYSSHFVTGNNVQADRGLC